MHKQAGSNWLIQRLSCMCFGTAMLLSTIGPAYCGHGPSNKESFYSLTTNEVKGERQRGQKPLLSTGWADLAKQET